MSRKGAAACWLVAGAAYLSLEFASATAVPGYRYDRDFISDLGRPDSPLHHLMNTAFVVQGTLLCLGAVLLARGSRDGRTGLFVGFAAANAVGNLVVAAVPSGGPGIAWVHVTGAVVAIVGGNAAILAGTRFVSANRAYRIASVALAALGLLSFTALAIGATTSATVLLPGAVWERTSVYTIIGWQMLSALAILRR
ncbi:hypothetical protein TUM20985_55080 [Mycobacterium antarcticum]|uniref:DUF998 domain-containing protein n=1 Tax=Mycolicibacterium sp. TUM20985 TaxID=3023370 RepID=UPI002572E04F|nr:DUF998 domain-containing protein [Mycolicibacterium sp. TUM20985]BDX34961.1 hypothetical protein TUM20985_55080 [Mycolicibacterium sp. TUM20985]